MPVLENALRTFPTAGVWAGMLSESKTNPEVPTTCSGLLFQVCSNPQSPPTPARPPFLPLYLPMSSVPRQQPAQTKTAYHGAEWEGKL
jgi:hypothetical protein